MPTILKTTFGRNEIGAGRLQEEIEKFLPAEKRDRASTRTRVQWDAGYIIEIWNSRAVMARAIRMQEESGRQFPSLRAIVALSPGEGY